MYYNIKIKSQKSEFILESNDKNVTQREMDIYFAYIFNASEEFKSKIKKVEINNTNLKSIDEIEKLANERNNEMQYSKFQDEKHTAEIIPKEIEQTQENTQPEVLLEQNENNIKCKNYTIDEKQEPIEQTNQTQGNIASEYKNYNIEIKNDTNNNLIETETRQERTNIEQTKKGNIEEIIELAQNKIDSADLSTKSILDSINGDEISQEDDNIIKFNIKEEIKSQPIKIKNTEEKEIYHNNNQNNINNIFSSFENIQNEENSNRQEITITALNEALEKNESIQKTNEIKIISQNPISFDNQNTIQKENNTEILENKVELPLDEIEIDILEENKLPENKQETDTILQNNKNVETNNETKGPVLDFTLFLSGFGANEMLDEFLICAYYIKNILHEENFSMKFINSKIFPATGKIADMSVAQTLIREGYISTINIDGIIKYTITKQGEEYFISKFQNKT